MLEVKNLLMRFNAQLLFEDVNLKLTRGNRYGLIGANGAGKSTFLKILAGEIEANSGEIVIENGLKVGVLGQDQFAFIRQQTPLRRGKRKRKALHERGVYRRYKRPPGAA